MNNKERIKDIEEILELAKEDLIEENKNVTAILDYDDLISLQYLLGLYNQTKKELNNLKEIEQSHQEENGKLRVENLELKEKNKEAREYMYDLLNADTPNVGTNDINNLLSILEEK